MKTEIRKTIRLSEEDYRRVEEIQKQHGFSDFSKTVCFILQNYPKVLEENGKLKEANEKQMTRVRLASSGADVNAQILLEILNTLCWQMQVKDFRSTKQMLHPVVEEAQKTVKERIAHFKQAKDFKTNK